MRNEPMRRNDLPETCFSILPSSGQLIVIRHGERGYYPSEWDTGSREENREIAIYISASIPHPRDDRQPSLNRTPSIGINHGRQISTIIS